MFATRVLILTLVVFVTFVVGLQRPTEVPYQWKYLNFTWESPQQYQEAVDKGDYIPKNNYASGIRIWKGQLYLTNPRERYGMPVALMTIPLKPLNGNKSPLLKPYPNWQMQKLRDCNAFQYLQGLEIDPKGRMWILDSGKQAYLENPLEALCPPRLVILDLENNGEILLNYVFPEDVLNRQTAVVNNLVLDHTDGGYAYMTNVDNLAPAIIVFSLKQKKSWSITHKSMYATAPIIKVKSDNQTVITPFNIDGIALSSASTKAQRLLYYCPKSSYELFSIPTDVLKNNPKDFTNQVRLVGTKSSQTNGMLITADDELYFGVLTDSQVSKWNTTQPPYTDNQQRVFGDDVNLVWPDTFAIDEMTKKLWVTPDKLDRIINNAVDINQVNFRIVLLTQLNSKSYQYYKNGTAPEVPMI